jgi:hypothetical protein
MSGHRSPPASTRFQKGRSGNPNGRPKGSRRQAPYEAVLGQKVTVIENGVPRKVTASEAFLLQVTRKGLEGDNQAARITLAAIEDARTRQLTNESGVSVMTIVLVGVGSVDTALTRLKMAKKYDPYRETAKIKLEPWLVQAALERMGERQLGIDEQRAVYASTRTPHKVLWPEWWIIR